MAVSKSKMDAIHKYDNKAYFKALIRFKKADEETIRHYAGDSLNGFVVSAVLEKIERLKAQEK